MPLRPARLVLCLSIIPCLLIAGCRGKSAVPARKPATTLRSYGATIKDAEIDAFGKELEEAFASGDSEVIFRHYDFNTVIATALEALDLPDDRRKGFIQQLGPTTRESFLRSFEATRIDQPQYTFLRHVRRRGQPCALFRLKGKQDGALNYQELFLTRGLDSKLRVGDIEDYMAGERTSETLSRTLAPGIAQAMSTRLERLTSKPNPYDTYAADLMGMMRKYEQNQPREALDQYAKLPDALKHEKAIQIIRIRCAGLIGDDEYGRALADFRELVPESTAIDVLAIGHLFARKQYAEVMACIDRLDRRVGGDPQLDAFRADVHLAMSDFPRAHAAIERAIAVDPSDSDYYWHHVAISLVAEDHPKTLTSLKRIVDRFHLDPGNLTALPDFAAFVKSPQYNDFLQFLSDHPPTPPPSDKP